MDLVPLTPHFSVDGGVREGVVAVVHADPWKLSAVKKKVIEKNYKWMCIYIVINNINTLGAFHLYSLHIWLLYGLLIFYVFLKIK